MHKFNPNSVQVLPAQCTSIARKVHKFNPNSVQVLPAECTSIARTVHKFCPHSAQVLPAQCTSIARKVYKFCEHSVQVSVCSKWLLKPPTSSQTVNRIGLSWCEHSVFSVRKDIHLYVGCRLISFKWSIQPAAIQMAIIMWFSYTTVWLTLWWLVPLKWSNVESKVLALHITATNVGLCVWWSIWQAASRWSAVTNCQDTPTQHTF